MRRVSWGLRARREADKAEEVGDITYYLGIDVGTTYTAAAVWRDGRGEVCSLGGHTPAVPSVAFLSPDGTWLIGEPADRRAASEPTRAAREFKRRVGDAASVLVGGSPFSADMLMARLLRWTADQVILREGGPPDGLVVSHPANWGLYKQDLLRQAISLVDLGDATFVSEPEAAAIHYAGQERLAPGRVVAVYDLGGGTFDAAVLRRTETGWEILGEPQGIERLGGIDFDEAVFRKVLDGDAGAAVEALDPEDPATRAALARLRRECVSAKEALASDTAVAIPVVLPNFHRDVRLMRSELEELVRPPLMDTITTMNQALRSAGVGADDLDAVLLVGGSSRLPLVAQIVGAELRRPVAIDVHPKHAVALGAATIAASRATHAAPAPATTSGSVPVVAPVPTSGSVPVTAPVSGSVPAMAPISGSFPATAPISGPVPATAPIPTEAPPPQPVTPPAPIPTAVPAEQPTVSGEVPAAPGPATGTGPAVAVPAEAPTWGPPGHSAATQHFGSAPAGPGPASGSVDIAAPAAPPGPAPRSRQKLVAAVAAVALIGVVAAVLLANRGGGGASAEPGATPTTTEASSTTTESEMVAVPNLVGSTEQQARDLLSDAGLQLQLTGQPTTDPDEDGVILAQDPAPRTEVERHSAVKLTIGQLETTATTSGGSGDGGNNGGGNGGGGSGGTTPTTTATTTPTTTTTTPTTTEPTTTLPPQPTTTLADAP